MVCLFTWREYGPLWYRIPLLFIAALILFIFDIKKFAIISSILLTTISALFLLLASQSYQTLSENTLSYSPLLSLGDHTYSWKEVNKITLNQDKNEDKTVLTFHFTDGNQMNLESNKYLWAIQNKFNKKLKEMNLMIENTSEE